MSSPQDFKQYQWDSDFRLYRRNSSREFAYSDGIEIEQRLLAIVSSAADRSTFSTELAEAITDWPSEYHLSRMRSNLLRGLGIKQGDTVLEFGCGGGAITRFLGELGAQVTAVEGSLLRARVTAQRCADLPNVTVVADDLLELEIAQRFDWVLMVGVLEYAPLFCGGPDPTAVYLRKARDFTGTEGRLVIAIENKLGLKYLNGCAEDHVGVPFVGVQGLYQDRGPVTFGKHELSSKLNSAGYSQLSYYYPFPDYKLPNVIISHSALNDPQFDAADLLARCQARDYMGGRYRSFDEALVFSQLQSNKLLADLSNSFLVVCSCFTKTSEDPALARAFATNRIPSFASQTTFTRYSDGIYVQKTPVFEGIARNKVGPTGATFTNLVGDSPYYQGRQMQWRLLLARARGADLGQIVLELRPWFDFLLHNSSRSRQSCSSPSEPDYNLASFEVTGDFLDCTPFNIIAAAETLVLFDKEWAVDSPIPLGWVVVRGAIYALSVGPRTTSATPSWYDIVHGLCEAVGLRVSPDDVTGWVRDEQRFQEFVVGYRSRPTAGDLCSLGFAFSEAVSDVNALQSKTVEQQEKVLKFSSVVAEQHDKIVELSNVVDEKAAHIDAQATQLEDLRTCNSRLQAEGEELQADRERAFREREDTARDIAHLHAQVSTTDKQLSAARQEVDFYRGEHGKALASISWKITQPLRAVNAAVRRAKGRAAAWVNEPAERPSSSADHGKMRGPERLWIPFRLWEAKSPRGRRRFSSESALLNNSVLLDGDWYLRCYPDVKSAGLTPAAHYLRHGWREGRDPGPLFNTDWYLGQYGDVAQNGMNPLVHFITYGASEGRFPSAAVANGRWFKDHFPVVLSYLCGPTEALSSPPDYDRTTPAVSIIVLNFNKALLTLQCLTSLWKYTQGHQYEIIVVDNGSSSEDLAILDTIRGPFRTIPLGVNRYFGEANNIGAEAAKGHTLVFMNNDIVVTPGWLDPLIKTLQEHPDAGAVGPTFVYPDGRLQEAGALIREDGRTLQRGKGSKFDLSQYTNVEPVDYVSAATVAIKASSFRRVLGFDFCWEPAYYEDVDLCLKLRSLGLRTYYCPKSHVYHFENATSADLALDLRLTDIVEVNREKFLRRWGEGHAANDWVSLSEENISASCQLESSRSEAKPSLALFSPYNMIPGGGEKYLLSIVQAAGVDCDSYLVTPQQYSHMRMATVARSLDLSLGGLRMTTLAKLDADFRPDVWVAMGNSMAPPAAPRGKKSIFILQFPFPTDRDTIERGRSWLDGYDLVVVYSEYAHKRVAELYRDISIAGKRTEIISPPVNVAGRYQGTRKRRGSIVSVGRFFAGGHCKNQHLMIEAFRQLTKVLSQEPLELHLAGSLHPEPEHRAYFTRCKALAEGLPVYFHLDAAPDKLEELYSSGSIYWHATGMDADLVNSPEKAEHFGITVVEAMARGCIPLVFSQGGPAEIVESGISGLTFDSMPELLSTTARVISEWTGDQLDSMRSAAISRALMFDIEYFNRSWRRLIEL
jgi:GT2 family glycosyltransferase/SAM-dependent methyltransferase